MTAGHSSAIEQALALMRAPALLAAVRQRPLPEDLPQLFRLAAGDEELCQQVESATGEPRTQLEEAAVFYLQQVLFAPGADSYRVLGVAPDSADDQIKQHFRLLQRWLHPDRNHDEWDAVYADRVNRAWQDLRTPERRAEYDRRVAEPPTSTVATHTGVSGGFRARPLPLAEAPVLSSRAVRRLPWVVLGTLGLLATVILGGAWYVQQLESAAVVTALPATSGVEAGRLDTSTPSTAVPASTEDQPPVASRAPVEPRPELPPETIATETPTDAVTPPAPFASEASEDQSIEGPPVRLAAIEAPVSAKPAPTPRLQAATSQPRTTLPTAAATATPAIAATAAPMPAPPSGVADTPTREPAAPAPLVGEATAALSTAESETAAAPPLLGEREAMALLEAFQRSYGAGDLQALLALFTGDARNNRGGLNAISEDYEQLFRSTDSRRIEWREPVWLGNGARGSVSARYLVTVLPSGELRPNVVEGDIRFDVRLDGEVARIERVRHQ